MGEPEPGPLDIPAFLLRDASNKAEFMRMATDSVTESRPAKSQKMTDKTNGQDKAPVKATGKPVKKAAAKALTKAKNAPKATVKAAKATQKAKAVKPKAASKVEKDIWGFRKGSAKSKAVAMYARKSGASLEEVKAVVGSVQLNVLNSLEAEGATVERVKEQREGQRAVTRYFLKART